MHTLTHAMIKLFMYTDQHMHRCTLPPHLRTGINRVWHRLMDTALLVLTGESQI